MALGIGASTAVFSVVKGVLLTPLPFREPGRVVLVPRRRARLRAPGGARIARSCTALRDRTDLFESVAVINESPGSLTSPDHMEAVTAVSASDNFLATLGVTPILGRAVTRKDVGEGFVNAVTISYDLWERRFQRDPDVVGRALEVNNLPMRIVGVLPKGFPPLSGPRRHRPAPSISGTRARSPTTTAIPSAAASSSPG